MILLFISSRSLSYSRLVFACSRAAS